MFYLHDTILLLAILVIVIVLLTSINSKFQQLNDIIYRLNEKVNELKMNYILNLYKIVQKLPQKYVKSQCKNSQPIVKENY